MKTMVQALHKNWMARELHTSWTGRRQGHRKSWKELKMALHKMRMVRELRMNWTVWVHRSYSKVWKHRMMWTDQLVHRNWSPEVSGHRKSWTVWALELHMKKRAVGLEHHKTMTDAVLVLRSCSMEVEHHNYWTEKEHHSCWMERGHHTSWKVLELRTRMTVPVHHNC